MKRTVLVRRALVTLFATGVVGAATVAPAAAVAPGDSAPVAPAVVRSDASTALSYLPDTLDCLLTTGWALFCLGVPLS